MTAFKGLGTYGDAVGVVTPLDHKLGQSGMIVKASATTSRPGLFWPGTATIVTGTAGMSYSVIAYRCATTRGAATGVVFGGNDGTLSVATTAAPGSNSRYDVVYHWHREFSIDGTDSNPVIGVIQGTAAASPTVPSLAAYPGAIELARILVPSGVTATNSGTTITQTAPFTAMAGGVVPFRNTTERDAGTYLKSQLGWLLDTDTLQKYNGTTWSGLAARERIIPTQTSTGGTVSVNSSTGEVTATGAVTQLNVTIPSATNYKAFEITYLFRGSTSGTYTVKLLSAGTPEATASSYRTKVLVDATSVAVAASTSFGLTSGSRLEHFRKAVVSQLAQAKFTTWDETGGSADAATNENSLHIYARHIVATALDGFRFDLSGMGTLADGSVIIEGLI